MSGRHATAQETEAYVLGALDPARAESFEVHAAECDTCAAALAREARLELAFEQVGVRAARVARWSRGTAYVAAAVGAMAAAALLWIGRAPTTVAGEGTAVASERAMDDGAIVDVRNDRLDGG